MKREIMRALAELEDALMEVGVSEIDAVSLVDGFEVAVEACLEEFGDDDSDPDGCETDAADGSDDDSEDDVDDSSDDERAEPRKGGYRVG